MFVVFVLKQFLILCVAFVFPTHRLVFFVEAVSAQFLVPSHTSALHRSYNTHTPAILHEYHRHVNQPSHVPETTRDVIAVSICSASISAIQSLFYIETILQRFNRCTHFSQTLLQEPCSPFQRLYRCAHSHTANLSLCNHRSIVSILVRVGCVLVCRRIAVFRRSDGHRADSRWLDRWRKGGDDI